MVWGDFVVSGGAAIIAMRAVRRQARLSFGEIFARLLRLATRRLPLKGVPRKNGSKSSFTPSKLRVFALISLRSLRRAKVFPCFYKLNQGFITAGLPVSLPLR
jgi:hypothetical protein